jgi:ABC-type bacteriocin/lantibiotic exporter with double-glycine peptidase domain
MKNNNKTPWQRFIGLLELEKKDIFQIFYYAIFSGIVALSLPLGIQAIINLIQGAQISTSWIVLVILVTIGVVFTGALQLMQLRIIETIQQRIFTRSSFELAYRFPKIKMNELYNYYPPELANRFFDTLTIQKGLSKILIDVPAAFLQIIFALLLLSFYHPFFIVFGFLLLALVYIVFKYTAVKGLQTSLEESKYKYKVAHWIQEVARSIISFKLSGNTSLALAKNDELVSDYLKARESHFKILVIQFIQMISFKVVVTASLLIIGGALVLNQEMNIGQFVAAEIIIILIIASVEKLILGLESFYDVLTSIEKLGQVVDKKLENQKGETPDLSKEVSIELDNVEYISQKNNRKILQNISFKIPPKSRILINGANGAGKSTLLKLIAGILIPTNGNVFVNDRSLSTLKLNHYRSEIGSTLSGDSTFEGTIRENIVFNNPNISDDDIMEIFKHLKLLNFIKNQPKGLDNIIHPDGNHMPDSITKKLLLARAIIRKPKVLILEDPLDQIDKQESESITKFLMDKQNSWSLVIVSNETRWTSIIDEVITLEDGKIKKS